MAWDEDGDEADEGGRGSGRDGGGEGRPIRSLRYREDGFTPERQKVFLKALRRTGCVADAARKAGISKNSVDRARRKFADFNARCKAARALALPGLEAIAYQRATVGAPAKVIRKGQLVEVRVKPSDAMLRLLLAGAAPAKYGRYAGLPRAKGKEDKGKKLPERMSFESAIEKLDKALEAQRRSAVEKEGYSVGPSGELLPPGWRMVREEELARLGWTPPDEAPRAALPAAGEEAGEA